MKKKALCVSAIAKEVVTHWGEAMKNRKKKKKSFKEKNRQMSCVWHASVFAAHKTATRAQTPRLGLSFARFLSKHPPPYLLPNEGFFFFQLKICTCHKTLYFSGEGGGGFKETQTQWKVKRLLLFINGCGYISGFLTRNGWRGFEKPFFFV